MNKKYKYLIIAVIAVSLCFSCTKAEKQKPLDIENASSFMKANVPLISTHTLDNGIKVIIKKQESNRIFTMNVVYKGGLALVPKGMDGIEKLTLATMIRGSEKHSFEDLKNISFEYSSSMSCETGVDISWLNLTTIDKYWNQMLEVFTDAVIHPAFNPVQLNLVKQEAQIALKEELSDPYAFAVKKLHERTFKKHPYIAEKDGSVESIQAITIDDVKNWYSEKLTADRMLIVLVGNFDDQTLISQLNKTFGTIPVKRNKIPKVKQLKMANAVYTEEFPASQGIAYIRGDYAIPTIDTADFITLKFAYSILNELLFEVVRTQNAACYSVWANPHGFKATYGSLVVFKSDKPTLAKTAFDEAIAILASGKTINLKGQGIKTGEGRVTKSTGEKYAPIEENIEAYKAKFINAHYNGQVTNSAIASQLTSSQVYYDNPYEYLKFIDQINAITAEDVVRVINQYLVNGKISWIVVGDKEILSKVDKSKFTQFTGKIEK